MSEQTMLERLAAIAADASPVTPHQQVAEHMVRAILTELRESAPAWCDRQGDCPHCDEYSFPQHAVTDFLDAILEGKA